MTIFDEKRLSGDVVRFDADGIRRGDYTDQYFVNIVRIFDGLRSAGYRYAGDSPRGFSPDDYAVHSAVVEAQIFTRRKPSALIAGVDAALHIIKRCAGHFDETDFVPAFDALDVEAVYDGDFTHYSGDTLNVQPVLRIRGRYGDFALLETPLLGYLTRATRIASRVHDLLKVANGKDVLFFPARFDLPDVQSLDGYAYWLAVTRHNHDNGAALRPLVSTDAQAAWWGGKGGGTVPHAAIACFLADTASTMEAFARMIAPDVPRIALVDFNNDVIGDSLRVLNTYWPHYCAAYEAGDETEMRRWTLNGVRVDTAGNMRDIALSEGDDSGVTPKLIRLLRAALDSAWTRWDVPSSCGDVAQTYCRNVKIVASGGFNAERIERFEAEGVPVDSYGVGSAFLMNNGDTDFTMDVVRVKLDGRWVDVAKSGRAPADNPGLHAVDMEAL